MTRTQKTVFALFVVVALILGVAVKTVLDQRKTSFSPEQIDAGIILLPQSRAIPALQMTDQDGQPVSLDQLKGKWSVLFFGYTFCPDICPTTLAQLRQIKAELPKTTVARMQVILVSVDPQRDTPAKLKEYLGYFDKDFRGFNATVSVLESFAKAVSMPYVQPDTSKPNYTVSHSGNLALLGPDGTQRGFIRAPFSTPKLVAQLPAVFKGD
ncbi:SCO family protein [Pseudomonas sp. MWU16-30317]|uniref:SCO family protein n=1 Tax=Pseudomonas sp. MWU16-30317 TaxID=2878095 RepID=UPI001CFAFE10|nr:SCO family protein [Pseudomonas sp. MWU16-30317]